MNATAITKQSRVALVIFLVNVTGACSPTPTTSTDRHRVATDHSVCQGTTSRETIFHAGEVVAGEVIRHRFACRNESDFEWNLSSDDEIRSSCGCTRVNLVNRRLEPGKTTVVSVEIDTASKRGMLSEQVDLRWTNPAGDVFETRFVVQAQVRSALALDPAQLHFSQDDVRLGRTKRVHCDSDLEVDLSDVQLNSSDSYLQVVDRRVTNRKHRLELEVACQPTGTGDSRQGSVQLSLLRPVQSAADRRSRWVVTVPVYSEDTASLRVSPKYPSFHQRAHSGPWQGQLIVTGDAISGGASVGRVHSDVFDTDFQVRRIGPGILSVCLSLTPKPSSATDAPEQLKLELTNGETAFVPILRLTSESPGL